ncbi:MAG: NosD domain-containing protein [Candidatus Hodarchaeales archaeon]
MVEQEQKVNTDKLNEKLIEILSKVNVKAYTFHDPISITNDESLKKTFPGNGTIEDPVRIEGYNITASYGVLISISYTTAYFCISNNFLDGQSTIRGGIWLQNVVNGVVDNNFIVNTPGNGIKLSYSNNTILSNNTVLKSNGGISMDSSNGNVLSGNTIMYNNYTGIGLWSNSDNNILSCNTILHNTYDGIYVGPNSENNFLSGNQISFNGWRGIHSKGDVSYFFDNTISFNTGRGIRLGGNNNLIKRNIFRENQKGYSLPLQAEDAGLNNIFNYNFWFEWTNQDNNRDGVVDEPYSIYGSANNQDPFPLVSTTYQLSVPTVIFPNGGERLSGIVTIQWTTSLDTWGHDSIYILSYSIDNGISWIILGADYAITTFDWDTTKIANGTNYLVRINASCHISDTSDVSFAIDKSITTIPETSGSSGMIALVFLFAVVLIIVIQMGKKR